MSRGWHHALAAFGLGLLLAPTQAPLSIFWLLPIGIAGLFLLWLRSTGPWHAFRTGWFAGTAYFAGTLFWIVEPFLVEPEKFAWLIPIALPAMAGGMALFWGAGFALAYRMRPIHAGAPVLLAACWMLAEALRGFILTGFPWSLLGYGLVETPAIQVAALIGINGVTLFTLLAGCLLGSILGRASLPMRAGHGITALAIIAGAWVYGHDRLGIIAPERTDPVMVGLVQPNVPQTDKWNPQLRSVHLEDLLRKTRALSDQGADVVLWPEAATPFLIADMPDLRLRIAESLRSDGVLLAGGIRAEGRGTQDVKVYNSLIAMDGQGSLLTTYDKQHLVPFGEYLPFSDLMSGFGLQAIAAALPGGFTAGSDQDRRIETGGLPPFAAMVCYEAIFAHEIVDRGAAIEWLVHVTNDAWFGAIAGPQQHLAQTRVRAIERGVPVARAANTGISTIIDAHGRIVSSIPLNESGVALGRLPGTLGSTPYHETEELVFILLLIIALLSNAILGGLNSLRRSRNSQRRTPSSDRV